MKLTSAQLEQFDRDGYLFFPGRFTPEETRMLVDGAPDPGVMRSDQTKLRQNLFNLLSNAAKFTKQGTITLAARRIKRDQRDWLEFKVRDTGIGMTEAQLGKLRQRLASIGAVVAVVSGKGGVGKTTLSVNLAVALAKMDRGAAAIA